MKSQRFCLAILFAAGLLWGESFAQTRRWYFGSGLGAQQWHGPLTAKLGMGGELTVGRQLSRHGGLALVAGFASLPFQQSRFNNGVKTTLITREANLFHGDFFVDLHPLGMRAISPFVRMGGGVLNVQVGSASRKNYVSGALGAGFRLQLTRDLALNLSGDYHHLVGQTLAGFDADKNPQGYVSARVGFAFSANTGDEPSEEPWFTTSDSELSPFAKTPVLEKNAPADSSQLAPSSPKAKALLVDEEKAEDEDDDDEQYEPEFVRQEEQAQPALAQEEQIKPEPVQKEEQAEPSVETAPTAEENAASKNASTENNEIEDAGDPFARFNRKLDLLEQQPEHSAPVASEATISPLGDEPKFEEFYPQAKPGTVENLRDKLFTVPEEREQEEQESEPEAVPANSAFEDRLAKLDEEEDFLSPETAIADTPTLPTPSAHEEESLHAKSKEASPADGTKDKNLEALIPARENQTLAQKESAAETEWPQLQEPTSRKEAAPVRKSNSAVAPPAKPRSNGDTDEELQELRAILDKLDPNGAARFEEDINSSNALALNADPEVAELRLRLDQIEGRPLAQKPSEAYEAFKDRLGLAENEAKKTEPLEWNPQRLKTQISGIDQELAQKEDDLNTIRTALAQSAATGAALPTGLTLTRGTFAQGYEGALGSFYIQRFDEAIGKFSRLLEEFPTHTLTSNCHYWLGEAQYGAGDYQGALASFTRVLNFQRSLKKDNALLMLGKTYIALKRPLDAKASLNRLLSEYPASDAVLKAQELLKSM